MLCQNGQALWNQSLNYIIISYAAFCTKPISIKILWHCECAILFNLCVCSHRATSAGISGAQTVICCDSPSLWCHAAMWPSSRILTTILGFTLCSYLYPQPFTFTNICDSLYSATTSTSISLINVITVFR